MPISENELMWSRSLPEEVEVDRAEVVADVLAGTDGQQPGAEAVDESAAPESVVRVGTTSGLEATLARLEMNSLAIRLHLEELEERIGRIQPHGEQPISDRAAAAEPTAAMEEREVRAAPMPEATDHKDDAPALSSDAKEKRWSHLIGPELDALMAMQAPAVTEASRGPSVSTPLQGGFPSAKEPLAGFPDEGAGEPQRMAPVERPMRMAAAADRYGELPGTFVTDSPDRLAAAGTERVAAPAAISTQQNNELPPTAAAMGAGQVLTESFGPERQMEARADAGRPALDSARHEPRLAVTAPRAAIGERADAPLPPGRMFSSFAEPMADATSATVGPKIWRGYRVRQLVWAVVLLVLAAIPLAIWWRLSEEARDADAGDSAPASLVEPGVVARPAGRSGSHVATAAIRRTPTQGLSAAAEGSLDGRTGREATAGMATSSIGAAPVVRRPPSDRRDVPSAPLANARGLGSGGRTSSGTAAATTLGGQPGGADEVPGSSGLRVRVPEGVMDGRLLPTGDVGELPHGSGEVVAAVFISNTGRVEEVQVLSGKGGLREAAARAIRNWRYEPYVQDGVRVPVVTTASIRFGGETAQAQ